MLIIAFINDAMAVCQILAHPGRGDIAAAHRTGPWPAAVGDG
jgi:hypothetical protein